MGTSVYRARHDGGTYNPPIMWRKTFNDGIVNTYSNSLWRPYIPYLYAITDLVGRPDSYNAVSHIKFRVQHTGVTRVDYVKGLGPRWVKRIEMFPLLIPPDQMLGSQALNYWLVPDKGYKADPLTNPAYKTFCNEAFFSFSEQIPMQIDGLNFFRDLATIKGLGRQIKAVAYKIFDLLKLANLSARGRSRTLRELSKSVADGHLINQFGIKPLVSELISFHDRIIAAKERINFLIATQGKSFPARYTKEFNPTRSAIKGRLETCSGHGDNYYWFENIQQKVTWTATCVVRNDLRGLEDTSAQLQAWLTALGLGRDNIVAFVWDLVPFSFVIDWFLSINKWIERNLSYDPYQQGELRVTKVGVSCKAVITADCYLKSADMEESIRVASVDITKYERRPGLSTGSVSSLKSMGLTLHQMGILSALVAQRVK